MSRLHTASESIDDIAVRWFTRQAAADFTAQEAAELEAWLDDDPAHRAAYDAVVVVRTGGDEGRLGA